MSSVSKVVGFWEIIVKVSIWRKLKLFSSCCLRIRERRGDERREAERSVFEAIHFPYEKTIKYDFI